MLAVAGVDLLGRVAKLEPYAGSETAETLGERLKPLPKILSVFFTSGRGDAPSLHDGPSMPGMRENQANNRVGRSATRVLGPADPYVRAPYRRTTVGILYTHGLPLTI